MAEHVDELAPVDYLVFAYDKSIGHDFGLLLDLVEHGLVRVLDLAFVRAEADGSVSLLAPSQVPVSDGPDPSVFEGAFSGLLQPDDVESVARLLRREGCAIVLVYENAWTDALVRGEQREGGRLLASGRVTPEALRAILDHAPASSHTRTARQQYR